MDNKKTALLFALLVSLLAINSFLSLIAMSVSFALFTLFSSSLSGYAGIIILLIALFILGLGLGLLSYYAIRKFSDKDTTRFFGAFFTSTGPACIIAYFIFLTRLASTMSSKICSSMPLDANSPISIYCAGQTIEIHIGMLFFTILIYLPLLVFFYRKKERNNKAIIWLIISVIVCVIAIPWIVEEVYMQSISLG